MARAFVDEYLVDLNAKQAAIRAGYSVRSADKIGPELLGKTRVAKAIAAAQKKPSGRSAGAEKQSINIKMAGRRWIREPGEAGIVKYFEILWRPPTENFSSGGPCGSAKGSFRRSDDR